MHHENRKRNRGKHTYHYDKNSEAIEKPLFLETTIV